MKCTFRDDDRHASISSQTWSDFPRLSLRGRTFLTITCATGMAIDQPCKSNNNVPSNVLSFVTFFFSFFFFFAQISLNRQSLLPATKKLECFYYLPLDTLSKYAYEISWKFSFFFFVYIKMLNCIAFCIADDREIYYLKTFALLIIIIFYTIRNIEKKKKRQIQEIYADLRSILR